MRNIQLWQAQITYLNSLVGITGRVNESTGTQWLDVENNQFLPVNDEEWVNTVDTPAVSTVEVSACVPQRLVQVNDQLRLVAYDSFSKRVVQINLDHLDTDVLDFIIKHI